MSEVKRFEIIQYPNKEPEVVVHPEGRYVLYEDYAKLIAIIKDALTCDQYNDHSSGSWQIAAEELGIEAEPDEELDKDPEAPRG